MVSQFGEGDVHPDTTPFFANMDDDIREGLVGCADQMLAFTNDWSQTAISMYRLLGVDENKIYDMVTELCEPYLSRVKDESEDGLLEILDRELVQPVLESAQDWNLTRLRERFLSMPLEKKEVDSYGRVTLNHVVGFMHRIGNETGTRRAMEALLYSHGYHGAFKAAEYLGDDLALSAIGLMALAEETGDDSFPHYNYMSNGLSALGRIRNPEFKNKLRPFLYAIGESMDSNERFVLKTSLRALRSSGEFLGLYPEEGTFSDEVTRVDDSEVGALIKIRAEKAIEIQDFWGGIKGFSSIGDDFRLNQLGEMLIGMQKYKLAASAFTESQNEERFLVALDLHVKSPHHHMNDELGLAHHLHDVAKHYHYFGYASGLEDLRVLAETKLETWDEYSLESGVWEWLRDDVKNWLTPPADVPRHIRNGQAEEQKARYQVQELLEKATSEVTSQILLAKADRRRDYDEGLNARNLYYQAAVLRELENGDDLG